MIILSEGGIFFAESDVFFPGMVGVQSGADKVYEEAMLELRKLRAHMQFTFDKCQDEAGRCFRHEYYDCFPCPLHAWPITPIGQLVA